MVEIRFDNVTYPWWQQVDVRASVDDVAATVGLAVTRSGTGGRLGVSENTVIQVMVDGMLAATVRPDVIRRRVDAQSHSISIDARSLGRELIDTQYSQTLSGLKLGEIVERLGNTFGVPVVVAADTKPVKDFAMQAESPATALINAARVANLLLYATPDGGIKLSEPDNSAPVAELRYGLNIAGYEVVDEYRLRFSEYLVKGYDHVGNKALRGAVKDDEINYFRPLHIIADKLSTGVGSTERRAIAERNRRKARAHRISLEVVGWQHAGGLWAINTQVRALIPGENIDAVYLIGERAFYLDDRQGRRTHLELIRRDAFLEGAT